MKESKTEMVNDDLIGLIRDYLKSVNTVRSIFKEKVGGPAEGNETFRFITIDIGFLTDFIKSVGVKNER